jgi:hypothetical protein
MINRSIENYFGYPSSQIAVVFVLVERSKNLEKGCIENINSLFLVFGVSHGDAENPSEESFVKKFLGQPIRQAAALDEFVIAASVAILHLAVFLTAILYAAARYKSVKFLCNEDCFNGERFKNCPLYL